MEKRRIQTHLTEKIWNEKRLNQFWWNNFGLFFDDINKMYPNEQFSHEFDSYFTVWHLKTRIDLKMCQTTW